MRDRMKKISKSNYGLQLNYFATVTYNISCQKLNARHPIIESKVSDLASFHSDMIYARLGLISWLKNKISMDNKLIIPIPQEPF